MTEMKSVYSAVRTGSLNKAVCACATYRINRLVLITKMKSVYSAVRTRSLNKAVCACATYSINWSVFIIERESVYSAVQTGALNKAVCACATYSINWSVFIIERESVYSAVRTGDLNKAVCAPSFKRCLVIIPNRTIGPSWHREVLPIWPRARQEQTAVRCPKSPQLQTGQPEGAHLGALQCPRLTCYLRGKLSVLWVQAASKACYPVTLALLQQSCRICLQLALHLKVLSSDLISLNHSKHWAFAWPHSQLQSNKC
jgi:hypothetical protein